MTNLELLTGLALLKSQGATKVVIEYSGEGDSGGIDAINVSCGRTGSQCSQSVVSVPDTLRERLIEWADAVLAVPTVVTKTTTAALGSITINEPCRRGWFTVNGIRKSGR